MDLKNNEEILDIVDAHDRVIRTAPRSELNDVILRDEPLRDGYFRAINGFIENDKGQLWIPRRTATKKLFPFCLDTSVGGGVSAGETYEQAFAREALEEVNIDISRVAFTEIGYLNPLEHGVFAFMKVYKIRMNEAPAYNTDDFCDYYWLTPHEVAQRIVEGECAKSDLLKLLNILYLRNKTT